MYSEEDLEERKKYKHIQICGTDVFTELKKNLTDEQFATLNEMIKNLTEADTDNKEVSNFPEWLTKWYYNKNDYYYHKPNNEEFLGIRN